MTIFNSLGSNYDLAFALRAEFSLGSARTRKELIDYLEKRYQGRVTLTYKGRDAITSALTALAKPQDSVAINGFTCIALFDAVKNAGMTPLLLDIEKDTLDFSAATLEKALDANPSIKAVIVQNTLGIPCEGEKIAALCKERDVALIEDLAHSIGARYAGGSEVGTLGDATILSFGQDKVVDAVSGGALVMRRLSVALPKEPETRVSFKRQIKDRLYPRFTWDIRATYRWYGKLEHSLLRAAHMLPRPLESESAPSRLPNWYTPLILRQCFELTQVSEHRRRIALIYAQKLDTSVQLSGIETKLKDSANLRFPIFVNDREKLISHLRTRGIHVSDIWYDAPIAPAKYAAHVDYAKGTCPNAEYAAKHILNLPTHINTSVDDAEKIAFEINEYLAHNHGTHF